MSAAHALAGRVPLSGVWLSHQAQHRPFYAPTTDASGKLSPTKLHNASPACSNSLDREWSSARQRQRLLVCRAAGTGEIKQLPIFPLNVVALPHATVPLMIFEARYRVLFNTLLAGSPNIEDGLVQEESPFAGSKRFGMCYVSERGMCAVGTTLEIQNHVINSDGRMYITNKGVEKFVVKKVVKETPVLICEVEVLQDDQYKTEQEAEQKKKEAEELSVEVADLFRNVLRLHLKMNRTKRSRATRSSGTAADQLGSEAEDEMQEAAELTELDPVQLSYWIAHTFTDVRYAQQALLEEEETVVRLKAEKDLLERTLKYYTAATALEGVFSSSESSSSSSSSTAPPPGGPD